MKSAFFHWRAICLALVVCVYPLTNASAVSRLALVVGNSQYAEQPLVNPVNDANAVASQLTKLGFQVTKKLELKRDDIGSVVEQFLEQIAPGDEVVFFYAGHGLQVDRENYLIAVDASIRSQFDVSRNSISVGNLLRRLDATRASVRIIFLDACRNNPFTRAFRGAAARGLAGIGGAPSGTLISFATQPGGVAADGKGQHGLYTEQLLAHMDTPGLPVEQMLKRVAASTHRKSRGEQRPWIEGSILGEFVFRMKVKQVKQGEEVTEPKSPGTDRINEFAATAWKYVEGSNSRAAYEDFLKEFGNTAYARLARIKLATLGVNDRSALTSPKTSTPRPADLQTQPKLPITPASRLLTAEQKWGVWQRSMRGAYEHAASLIDEGQKRAAMERFLREYAADNPYVDSDRQLRHLARAVTSPLGRRSDKAAETKTALAPVKIGAKSDTDELTRANAAYDRKDYAAAALLYRPLAGAGNAIAQMRMGRLYFDGNGLEKSISEAFEWWTKAADNGNGDAQGSLGSMYLHGRGTERNPTLATKWIKLSAEQGSATGMNNMGLLYSKGIGITENAEEAVDWFRRAAENGYARAQRNLGVAYLRGNGVRKDTDLAYKWLKLSADQGYALGMNGLGVLYEKGLGVRSDEKIAFSWYRRAADMGEIWAMSNVAKAYNNGVGVSIDYREAAKWYDLVEEKIEEDPNLTQGEINRLLAGRY